VLTWDLYAQEHPTRTPSLSTGFAHHPDFARAFDRNCDQFLSGTGCGALKDNQLGISKAGDWPGALLSTIG
jgi:hypothetical protein